MRSPVPMQTDAVDVPADMWLGRLAIIHFVVGISVAILARIPVAPPYLRDYVALPVIALAACQSVLLAFWATNSAAPISTRLAALAGGIAYLETLEAGAFSGEVLGLATTTLVVSLASLSVLRHAGVRLVCRAEQTEPRTRAMAGLRFSIRDLMLVTAFVAILIAGARFARSSPVSHRLLMTLLAAIFVTVALGALWSALGNAETLARGIAVVILSTVIGFCFGIAANAHQNGWVNIIATMLLYSGALLASLHVVRTCGYRLERTLHA